MSDAAMNFSVESMKRVELVTVSGRIDSSNAAEFEGGLKQLTGTGRSNLVLNLAGVTYMSSAGLRTLVSTLKECKRGGGDVRLAAPSERVSEVLSLAGLDSLFKVFEDDTAAVGSF
ncbi:STAS domain-containing protein [Candidatus Leptofilum sp.]|uniref:STAS domain-containing protein n=1 Tax=Candidatus Leptofilum sp. TaxID=3241576 RepID=UPI003B5A9F83